MKTKIFGFLFTVGIIMFSLCGSTLATEAKTTTSTINGTTVNWSYELNNSNQIINLKCTNIDALTGNITIPSTLDEKSVISIGSNAFKSSKITGVTIPSSIKSIGANAFSNCSSLTDVNLGSIESIGSNAFSNCTSLESIIIPKSLKSTSIMYPVFNGCTKLTKITLEDGLTIIPSYLLKDTNITNIEIPNSVKSIGYNAFGDCTDLKKITILDNVTTISDEAFKNHNKDLTIYCYEGSTAAKYAIDNNIKYVYLKREANTNNDNQNSNTNTSEKDNNNSPESDNNNSLENKNENQSTNNKDGNSSNNSKNDKKENSSSYQDKTKAPSNLPKTGISMTIVISILTIALISVISYKKYVNYKNIK